jgi:hypothetical protein
MEDEKGNKSAISVGLIEDFLRGAAQSPEKDILETPIPGCYPVL